MYRRSSFYQKSSFVLLLMLVRLCVQPPKTKRSKLFETSDSLNAWCFSQDLSRHFRAGMYASGEHLDVRDQVCDLLHVIGVVMMTLSEATGLRVYGLALCCLLLDGGLLVTAAELHPTS